MFQINNNFKLIKKGEIIITYFRVSFSYNFSQMKVEVCVDSILSIQNAYAAKVDRIELCSALEVGGLTPSNGLIKEATDIKLLPIHCLIRPRPGHFFYNKEEIKVIEKNILNAYELGCHGVVIGAHDKNFKLDLTLLKRWKTLAGKMHLTFHRAFDVLVSPLESINQLIDLGFDCILTSGQKEKAEEGIDNLTYWNTKFGSDITIMPGSGVGVLNCKKFKKEGFKYIHLSAGVDIQSISIPDGINQNLSFLKQKIRHSDKQTLIEVVKSLKSVE